MEQSSNPPVHILNEGITETSVLSIRALWREQDPKATGLMTPRCLGKGWNLVVEVK